MYSRILESANTFIFQDENDVKHTANAVNAFIDICISINADWHSTVRSETLPGLMNQ